MLKNITCSPFSKPCPNICRQKNKDERSFTNCLLIQSNAIQISLKTKQNNTHRDGEHNLKTRQKRIREHANVTKRSRNTFSFAFLLLSNIDDEDSCLFA